MCPRSVQLIIAMNVRSHLINYQPFPFELMTGNFDPFDDQPHSTHHIFPLFSAVQDFRVLWQESSLCLDAEKARRRFDMSVYHNKKVSYKKVLKNVTYD